MADKTLAEVIHDNWAALTEAKPILLREKQRYPDIADAMNAQPQIPNSVTSAPQVAKAITLKAIMSLVPAAEMVKCYQLPGFIDDVRRAIDSDDREYMGILIAIAAAATAISSGANSTVTKLQTLLAATEADPTWTATIAGPSLADAAGLGTVTAADVQAADQASGGAGQYAIA